MEPGRFLVAHAGALLARVTQIKTKGDVTYVGVDAGMNSLIRPALYGAYHPIINLSRLDDRRTLRAHVVGPVCETGDVLGHARQLPECVEGDVMGPGQAYCAKCDAGTHASAYTGYTDSWSLSQPAQIGEVDFFISHAW